MAAVSKIISASMACAAALWIKAILEFCTPKFAAWPKCSLPPPQRVCLGARTYASGPTEGPA